MSVRTLLLTTAALLAVTPAVADAQVREMRFLGSLTGSQTTTWDEPLHGSPASDDCFHVNFVQARGGEEWTFGQSHPTKVLATRIGTGPDVSLSYGTFNPMAIGKKGIVVSSQQTRTYERTDITKPGECGGVAKTEVIEGSDCGTIGQNSYGDLNFVDGRAELHLLHDDHYDDCPLEVPKPVSAGFFVEVGPEMRGAELLNPKRKVHVILGSDTFTQSWPVPDGGTVTTTTTVEWQLRLKRVK